MAEEEEFERRSLHFVDWLKQNGGKISEKISIADLRDHHAGRGVLTKEDIEEDEELFSIPRTSILTVENSDIPADLKSKVEDSWLSLILVMIYEYQKGPDSKWKAYFDVLPAEFDTLMYWDDEELESLKGSAVLEKIGKSAADQSFKDNFIPIIRDHASIFHASDLDDHDILRLCHRMGSTIMAYAFDLEDSSSSNTEADEWKEDSDGEYRLAKGMVPLADTLNADADRNNAKLFYEDDHVVMKAIKLVAKGEELLNDYGPLPRADVLRRYGYVTEQYARYDVVEVSLDLIKTAAKEDLKLEEQDINTRAEYLEGQGVLDDGYDISRASNGYEQFPEEFCLLLNALTMDNEYFGKMQKKERLPKPGLSDDALELLKYMIDRRRVMYSPVDEASDMKLESTEQLTSKSGRRQTMALQVIEGEKAVLQEAAGTVQSLLGHGDDNNNKRKADERNADTTEPHAKKRKDGQTN